MWIHFFPQYLVLRLLHDKKAVVRNGDQIDENTQDRWKNKIEYLPEWMRVLYENKEKVKVNF